jgi:hypothetical protein
MSMLVGSNALLLTLPFAIAVILGRVNLKGERYLKAVYGEEDENGEKVEPEVRGCSKEFFLRTGVTVHRAVDGQAQLMVVSLTAFAVLQFIIYLDKGAALAAYAVMLGWCVCFFLFLLWLFVDVNHFTSWKSEFLLKNNKFRAGLKIMDTVKYWQHNDAAQIEAAGLKLLHEAEEEDAKDDDVLHRTQKRVSQNERTNRVALMQRSVRRALEATRLEAPAPEGEDRTMKGAAEPAAESLESVALLEPSATAGLERQLSQRNKKLFDGRSMNDTEKEETRRIVWVLMDTVPEAQLSMIFEAWVTHAEHH